MKEVRMYAQKFIDRGKVYILYSYGCYLCMNKKLIVTLMVCTCTVSRVFFV